MSQEDIAHIFFQWVKRNNTGCSFAATHAYHVLNADATLWHFSIYEREISYYRDIGEDLKAEIGYAADGGHQLVTALFPKVQSPEELINLLSMLNGDTLWSCREIGANSQSNIVHVSLKWYDPSSLYINTVLGLSNLKTMPQTRRAPYTALVIKIGGPGDVPALIKKDSGEASKRPKVEGRCPVGLTDVPSPVSDRKQTESLWSNTKNTVRHICGVDEYGAGARPFITFSLPEEYRAKIDSKVFK